MKKILSFVMVIASILAISFSFSACRKAEGDILSNIEIGSSEAVYSDDTESDNNTSPESIISSIDSNNNIVSTENQSQASENLSSYEDIVCVKASGYKQLGFVTSNSNTIINITVPVEWNLNKSNSGYDIIKNSKQIGSVTTDSDIANNGVNVFSANTNNSDVEITHNINRVDSANNNISFNRSFVFSYNDGIDRSIVVTVQYQELDSTAVFKIIDEIERASSNGPNFGILPLSDNRNRILILGNSFIATSQIGSILQEMCGTSLSVEAVSRGMATVKTYAENASIVSNMRAGQYSAVFMCGFYNVYNPRDFATIVSACRDSNTKLVMFPAHNETRDIITTSYQEYPYAIMMDWKAEVDALISGGINYYRFCIDDGPQHSTPLAGYVGAHMIYRAIFNKVPQTTHFSAVSQAEINLLGKYVSSGSVINAYENIYSLE